MENKLSLSSLISERKDFPWDDKWPGYAEDDSDYFGDLEDKEKFLAIQKEVYDKNGKPLKVGLKVRTRDWNSAKGKYFLSNEIYPIENIQGQTIILKNGNTTLEVSNKEVAVVSEQKEPWEDAFTPTDDKWFNQFDDDESNNYGFEYMSKMNDTPENREGMEMLLTTGPADGKTYADYELTWKGKEALKKEKNINEIQIDPSTRKLRKEMFTLCIVDFTKDRDEPAFDVELYNFDKYIGGSEGVFPVINPKANHPRNKEAVSREEAFELAKKWAIEKIKALKLK